MARRTEENEEQKFSGRIDIKKFKEAASEVAESHQIPEDEIDKILTQAIDKAARETLYPNSKFKVVKKSEDEETEDETLKLDSAQDMHSETVIDPETGVITFYECKDVMNDDDITDDLYQISLEDAQDIQPDIKIGDVLKTKVDLSNLDYSFFTRAIQSFMQGIREATKDALVKRYQDKIGNIITATVERTEGKDVYLTVGRVVTVLQARNSIPGEVFAPGDQVKVLLDKIGTTDENGDKSTSLLVSRTSNKFLEKMFQSEIPDVADGSVVIKGVVREPGNRAKVAVFSPSPDIDPTGACIGSDGLRIKNICAQLNNEKIDVIRYQDNPELYIAEALKPATVVGVVISDEEPEEGKQRKAIAVVKNAESKIAIGKGGVNVRLASKLTGYSIDVKELDAAMADHISYNVIDDIRRKEALERLDQEEAAAGTEVGEEGEETEEEINETEANAVSAPTADNEVKPEEVKNEEVKAVESAPAVAPAPAAANEPIKEEVKAEEVKPVAKPEEVKPVEHVEIHNTAKVSLDRLEAQIEAEKNKKKFQPRSYKKRFDKKDEDDKDKKIVVANAMPIYTEEEQKEMAAQDDTNKPETEENGEDYSEYDSDQYYEDDNSKR